MKSRANSFVFSSPPNLAHQILIEVDGLSDRHDRIGPTLEEDQFPAAVAELGDVACHRAIERRPERGVDLDHVPFDVERAPIPVGAEHPFEEAVKPGLARGVAGRFEEAPVEDARTRCLAARRRRAACRSCRRGRDRSPLRSRPVRGSGNRRPRRLCRLARRGRSRRPSGSAMNGSDLRPLPLAPQAATADLVSNARLASESLCPGFRFAA